MNIQKSLMEKAQKKELAHFYIIESSLPEDEAFRALMGFTHDFIKNYYQLVEGQRQLDTLIDHPDVFVLGNSGEPQEKEAAFYTVAESQALSRFFEFKPVQSQRKFAVITEGHKINTIIANKWLKLFEEPQGQSTIFLLNPRRQKLLDTIHSRAQHLRLPAVSSHTGHDELLDFLDKTKMSSLAQFLENNLKHDQDVSFWSGRLIQWESEQLDSAASKHALTEWLKKLHEMDIFHQPAATKWSLFYSHLNQYVFPRLSR